MPQTTRLATCCYCGTRSALVLAGASSHRLACGACGAPLTQMKQLPCKGHPWPGRGGTPAERTTAPTPNAPQPQKPQRHEKGQKAQKP